MANVTVGISASDSLAPDVDANKPVIVRVKRKPHHSPLDGFWLEINERPWKRQMFDFENLSISDNPTRKNRQDECGPRKVLVTHFDTDSGSKEVVDVVQEFIALKPDEAVKSATRFAERKLDYKKQSKPTSFSSKSRQNHETLSRNIRLEQIWRSRTQISTTESLNDVCQFYDVVRVDDEESSSKAQEERSIEDRNTLSRILPVLKDHCPSAASELESLLRHCSSSEEFIYDYYALNEGVDMTEDNWFGLPLVQVEDEEYYYDENEDSECDSDSNAECNPFNEYPDESTDEGSDSEDDVDKTEDDVDEASVEEGSNEGRHRGGRDDSMGLFDDSSDDGGYDYSDDTCESEHQDFYY